MDRLFERHRIRKTRSLNGLWKFAPDTQCLGHKDRWYQRFPAQWENIVVPGCWNNELGLEDYEGIAWYETEFVSKSPYLNLVFAGFTGQIQVYLDGLHQGSHYGGFSGYSCLLEKVKPGKHKLTVAVDNTHNDRNTIPLARVDWLHYGGLFRSVELMELGETWIKDCKIVYTLDPHLQAVDLSVTASVQSLVGPTSRTLAVYINDELFQRVEVAVDLENTFVVTGRLGSIKLWSPKAPHLYQVRLVLEDDDLAERIGFRQIRTEDGKLFLNNEEIVLKGINRHEIHPDWGLAMPLQLMKKDLAIIKDLGCNSIRGSHYPNAPVFLDLLDETGMLFWEEIPMWGFPETALVDPVTLERGLAMHREMVTRDYHHPSLIVWGLHNEIDTRTQAAYDLTMAFANQVRALDSSRPLTYATMHPLEDLCYELVDIVSVNQYFGWYKGEIGDWEEFLRKLKARIKDLGREKMPLIISEFGAGAIYGEATFASPKWTEGFQEEYLDYTLNLFLQDKNISGMYIWQYCDIPSARELELSRPRSFNNKGIVNEYRKPKAAYWRVRQIYTR